MTSYSLAIIVSAVLVVFEVWNISQARRSGCVYLGILPVWKRPESGDFEITLLGNIIGTVLLLGYMMYFLVRQFGY